MSVARWFAAALAGLGAWGALAQPGLFVPPPEPVAAPATPAAALQRLAWLAGCWSSERGEPGTGEQWMPLAGGTLLGVSRTVKNGRTVETEFMQIRTTTENRVVYIAEPGGQKKVAFELLRQDEREVVFENLAHDFPQRVIYRRGEGGRLAARIEGLRDGTLRGVDFPLRRESCDAQVQRLSPR